MSLVINRFLPLFGKRRTGGTEFGFIYLLLNNFKGFFAYDVPVYIKAYSLHLVLSNLTATMRSR